MLRDLTGRGWANGFPGRHIFRIDEKIMLGTCNKDIGTDFFYFLFLHFYSSIYIHLLLILENEKSVLSKNLMENRGLKRIQFRST